MEAGEVRRPVGGNGRPRFAVVGAGNGGLAMAAHLGLKGFAVNLYNRTAQRIEHVRARGGIELAGEVEGFGSVGVATADIAEALDGVDVVMVVVPASGHADVARVCAPNLRDGQVVVLNPGRTGGALEFEKVVREAGNRADVVIAEAQTFIYASRSLGPAQARIFGVKNVVPLAALPAGATPRVLHLVNRAYPQFVAAPNVLKTSLDNMGAIFHPGLTLLNCARIESTQGEFEYYREGVTPTVASILEVMDAERVRVAGALGVRALSALEWLEAAYSATGESLLEAMRSNEGYKGIKAPPSLRHRYIFEDVPASLVPISSIGKMLGVPTPTLDCMIHLASLAHQTDYVAVGRTVETLGIAGMRAEEIMDLVTRGRS